MSANNKRSIGEPSGSSVVYRRIRRRTPEEMSELPPVRTTPGEFTGRGLGPYGRWRHGDPVGAQEKPTKEAEEALLDWALVSWARRHVVEEVWDYRGPP